MPPANPSADVLQGTLDLLILKAISLEPMHGWGISQRIRDTSRGVLEVNQGSLYPALHRLENRGLLDAEWGSSGNNRRAKFYRITAAGRRELVKQKETWKRFSSAVDLVVAATA
jgi:PadR family transcriptional regulator PadR